MIRKDQLLQLEPVELQKLQPSHINGCERDLEELEAIFTACGAFWYHSGNPEDPHVELTSGMCSNGFISCPEVLSLCNLSQIMAEQLVLRLRQHYAGQVDWVVGSDSAALGLAKDVANVLSREPGTLVRNYPMQKGPDKTQIWEKQIILPGQKVLHVEELMTTAGTAEAVRAGIKAGTPHPVEFVPFLPVLVHRPAKGEGLEVDGSKVIWVMHYDIWAVTPDLCELCRLGSKPLRPRAGNNWSLLTSSTR